MDEQNYEMVETNGVTEDIGEKKHGKALAGAGIVVAIVGVAALLKHKFRTKHEARMCKKLRKRGYTVMEPLSEEFDNMNEESEQ